MNQYSAGGTPTYSSPTQASAETAAGAGPRSDGTGVPVLEARDITKRFPGTHALDNVGLTVRAGEVLALVGENGAGKSTLIKILSGVVQPDSGEILIDGKAVRLNSPRDAERYGIVTVYQELSLFPALSVAENLFIGHYPRQGRFIDWRAAREEARQFLAGLGIYLPVNAPVASLSIAEKYMVEISKALLRQARVLILDEPTAVLGGSDVDELMRIVRGLRDRGVGVVFISHRLDEIFGLVDRYMVLKNGVKVDEGPIGATDHNDLVAKMVGRELGQLAAAPSARREARELLRVEGLSRAGVLRDISFTLHAGEVLGIAGLRGAGRTEVARAIFGADPIDAGRIVVKGREVRPDSPRAAVRLGIGLVPEDRGTQGLLKNFSTAQNISLVKMACFNAHWIDPTVERRAARGYVDSLRIKVPSIAASVRTLSGGNQQKAVLAKWLEAGISILILDEPTRGIDIGSKRQIYELVRRLCDTGLGVILISSELPEVLEMSDRILVMYRGGIAGELSREEASEEAIMNFAVGGQQV